MTDQIRNPPDSTGRFGRYGGRFVAETLVEPLREVEGAFLAAWRDPAFQARWRGLLRDFVGRPTPITTLRAPSGATIVLKREDLCHTGAHKVNNTIGQCLLALRMGKARVVAETGAGQHGVATATACALLGLPCTVFMGEEDTRRQALNVDRMRLLGAEVRPVSSGAGTLKDAINESMRHWVSHVEDTYYCFGSVAGPHPYPLMVRQFQSVIGDEAREQILATHGRLPTHVGACVGGGSNAIGLFHAFVGDESVAIVGVEAAGHGLATGEHSASIVAGSEGILHGALTYVLHDEDGQIIPAHSVSAGLDYPGVGPEHAHLHETGRARYVAIDDEQALAACARLAREEGIIAALETAHAIAWAYEEGEEAGDDALILVNCSGRGDKDMTTIRERLRLAETEGRAGGGE